MDWLKGQFKEAMKKTKGVIDVHIARFLFQYRITPHATAGQSPAQLLLKHQPRSALDLMVPDSGLKDCKLVYFSLGRMSKKKEIINLNNKSYTHNYDSRIYFATIGHGWENIEGRGKSLLLTVPAQLVTTLSSPSTALSQSLPGCIPTPP